VLEEALSIQRTLSQDCMAADTLIVLASAHGYLEIFDEVRSTLIQALDLTRRCDGEESQRMALCHHQMAFICHKQADENRKQVYMHMEYMSTNSICLYNSPVSRVLVKGLQKKLQYNGIEGVVVEMDALRMRVGLDTLNNKELMLKPENVCPLFSTALKLQEQLMKMHDLAQERISSSKEVHRIQINADPGRQDSTSCW